MARLGYNMTVIDFGSASPHHRVSVDFPALSWWAVEVWPEMPATDTRAFPALASKPKSACPQEPSAHPDSTYRQPHRVADLCLPRRFWPRIRRAGRLQ